MKYPGTNIRVAVYDLIKNILVGGVPVPVYDEQTAPDAGFPRIVLLSVAGGGSRNSKCGFGGDWSQNIKVTTAYRGRVTKNEAEGIANEILDILVPASSDFIDIGPDFSVWKVEGNVLNSAGYSDNVRTFIDVDLRITYSLTEK